MQSLPNLTCVVFSWGSHFDKYGQDFMKCVVAVDPQPTEFLFLTDKLREDLPNNFRQVLLPDIGFNNWMRYPLEHIKTDWWCTLGLDDLVPVDGFSDLVFDGEIVVSASMDSDGVVHTPTREGYDSMFEQREFQMQGWWMAKVGLFERIPSRPVVWEDWIQWFEFKMHDVDVRFDLKIRQFYRLHNEQRSNVLIKEKANDAIDNINLMRKLARQGKVKPGAVWPPELL